MKRLLFSAKGRIGRGQFWKGTIVATVAMLVVSLALNFVLGLFIPNQVSGTGEYKVEGAAAIPFVLVNFGVMIPATWAGVCLGIKRFHDRNKSGLWMLIAFVPLIGGLWYLVEAGCLRGTVGPNAYGPDPLGGAPADYGYAAA